MKKIGGIKVFMIINLNNNYISKKDIKIENSNIILYRIVNTEKFDNKISKYEMINNCKSILRMNYLTADCISEMLFGESFHISESLTPMYKGRKIIISDNLENMEVEIIDEL